MRYLSVCSGIEAASVAWRAASPSRWILCSRRRPSAGCLARAATWRTSTPAWLKSYGKAKTLQALASVDEAFAGALNGAKAAEVYEKAAERLSKAWLVGEDVDGISESQLVFGAVVAIADLVACIHVNHKREFDRFPWLASHRHALGPWCWVLMDVRVLPKPVPYKGAQGIWEIPDGLECSQ